MLRGILKGNLRQLSPEKKLSFRLFHKKDYVIDPFLEKQE
jgi:hypothetical protein